LTTLDRIVETENIRHLDFLKVDIEGSELVFLRGAERTLRRFKPVMMVELSPGALSVFGSRVVEVVNQLTAYGYTMYRLGKRGALLPIAELGANWLNVIAVVE